MRKIYLTVVALILALCSTSSIACREVSAKQASAWSDKVLVGVVSSVSIPSLENVPGHFTNEAALGEVMSGNRIVRLVVSEVRKGTAGKIQTMEVTFCHGLFVAPGDRVLALHLQSGYWRLDKLLYPQAANLPPLGTP